MSIFTKIFGSTQPKVAGDEGRILVPVYLESIKAGADPKTQVEKIHAIVGDSNAEFSGFLDELAMAGDEKPEVIAKAVDIVNNYYKEHLAGDESKVCPKCGKKPCACDKAGDEGKLPAGEEKKPEEKSAGEEKKPEGKSAGDEEKPEEKSAGDSIDYDILADKLAARMVAMQSKNPAKTAGDETYDELQMPLNGDSASDAHTSDDFIKDIWG